MGKSIRFVFLRPLVEMPGLANTLQYIDLLKEHYPIQTLICLSKSVSYISLEFMGVIPLLNLNMSYTFAYP